MSGAFAAEQFDSRSLPARISVLVRSERTGVSGGALIKKKAPRLTHDPASDVKAALLASLSAGTIDIVYAFLSLAPKGITASAVLQSIASGLLGKSAFQLGLAGSLLGLFLHYAMTFAMALLFITASRNVQFVRRNLIACGIVYGGLIYFAMRWVVVPLSRFPGDLRVFGLLDFAVHLFGVGLIIALFAPGGLAHRHVFKSAAVPSTEVS